MFILAICTSMISCVSINEVTVEPKWYAERSLIHASYEYIGYGKGTTKEKARVQANVEIAQSIRSHINVVNKENIHVMDEQFHRESVSISEVISDVTLSNIKLKKIQIVGDNVFIAYKYDNSSLAMKIARRLKGTICIEYDQGFLNSTPLFQTIKSQLGCIPKTEIFYKNDNWNLHVSGEVFIISQAEFELIFSEVDNKNVKLDLSKSNINVGDLYHINIQPKREGFLSLIQIFNTGEIQLLIDNKDVHANQQIVFPDLNEYDGLYAESSNKVNSRDLTLSILCSSEINLKDIKTIGIEIVSTNNHYALNSVLKRIDSCSVSSKVTYIKGI
jgi:hypothetical protein